MINIKDRLGEININTNGTLMKIIAYRKSDDIDVEFLDDSHYIAEHQIYSNFKNGLIKSPYDKTLYNVGYIGVGEYNTGTKKEHTKEYVTWRNMLRRCYDKKHKNKFPAYYGICTVCDEWHNFQTFAKWYHENIYYVGTERMHVDKDIICSDNKIYSPETCFIVPQRINMLFKEKRNKYNLPNGIRQKANGKYEAVYNGKHLGTFNTIEFAIKAHDDENKKAIIKIANEYRYKIPEKLYEALIMR